MSQDEKPGSSHSGSLDSPKKVNEDGSIKDEVVPIPAKNALGEDTAAVLDPIAERRLCRKFDFRLLVS